MLTSTRLEQITEGMLPLVREKIRECAKQQIANPLQKMNREHYEEESFSILDEENNNIRAKKTLITILRDILTIKEKDKDKENKISISQIATLIKKLETTYSFSITSTSTVKQEEKEKKSICLRIPNNISDIEKKILEKIGIKNSKEIKTESTSLSIDDWKTLLPQLGLDCIIIEYYIPTKKTFQKSKNFSSSTDRWLGNEDIIQGNPNIPDITGASEIVKKMQKKFDARKNVTCAIYEPRIVADVNNNNALVIKSGKEEMDFFKNTTTIDLGAVQNTAPTYDIKQYCKDVTKAIAVCTRFNNKCDYYFIPYFYHAHNNHWFLGFSMCDIKKQSYFHIIVNEINNDSYNKAEESLSKKLQNIFKNDSHIKIINRGRQSNDWQCGHIALRHLENCLNKLHTYADKKNTIGFNEMKDVVITAIEQAKFEGLVSRVNNQFSSEKKKTNSKISKSLSKTLLPPPKTTKKDQKKQQEKQNDKKNENGSFGITDKCSIQ